MRVPANPRENRHDFCSLREQLSQGAYIRAKGPSLIAKHMRPEGDIMSAGAQAHGTIVRLPVFSD